MRHVLFLDDLEPGDVVLSRAPTSVSRAIRLATASAHSHAALVLDPVVWFEALGDGVGHRVYGGDLVMHEGRLRLAHDCGRSRFVVLRHTDDAARRRAFGPRGEPADGFVRWIEGADLFSYPGAEAFLDLLPLGLGMRLAGFARRIDRGRVRGIPGRFCSQLVATAYADLGLPLFARRAASAVSPGRLARCPALKVVARSVRLDQHGPVPPQIARFSGQFRAGIAAAAHTAEVRRVAIQAMARGHSIDTLTVRLLRDLEAAMPPDRAKATAWFGDPDARYEYWRSQTAGSAQFSFSLGMMWAAWDAAAACAARPCGDGRWRDSGICLEGGCYAAVEASLASRQAREMLSRQAREMLSRPRP